MVVWVVGVWPATPDFRDVIPNADGPCVGLDFMDGEGWAGALRGSRDMGMDRTWERAALLLENGLVKGPRSKVKGPWMREVMGEQIDFLTRV